MECSLSRPCARSLGYLFTKAVRNRALSQGSPLVGGRGAGP